jgi:hypothetical protein
VDLDAVYAEIEAQVKLADDGLHVVKYGHKPQVPNTVVLLPDSAARTTYRGGVKVSDVQVLVLVGRADARQGLKDLWRLFAAVAGVLDPAFNGPYDQTVTWDSCSDVTITEATFDTATMAGATDVYLAVLFHLDITGTGA